MKSYVLRVDLEEEQDGRWSAWIAALPGCAAWRTTRDEALQAIEEAAEVYIEDLREAGEDVPDDGIDVIDAPVVTVRVA